MGWRQRPSSSAQAPKPERDWPSHGHDAGARSDIRRSSKSTPATCRTCSSRGPTTRQPRSRRRPPRGGGPARLRTKTRPLRQPARGDRPRRAPSRPAPRQSASTPLVVDGVMYLATTYNRVVALDADTGKEIWVKDIGNTPSTRGLAYWPGAERHSAAARVRHRRRVVAAHLAERENGRVRAGIRTRRQGRSAAGRRREISEAPRGAVVASGDLQASGDYGQSLAGEPEPRTLGRCARVGPADGQARCGRFTRFHGLASRTTTRGRTSSGSIARERMPGDSSPSTKRAGLPTFRSEHLRPIFTAAIGLARTCTGRRCWRSTRRPENSNGFSRPRITITGITT